MIPLQFLLACFRFRRGLWCRTGVGQDVSVRSRMQGCHLHLARMYHRDTYFFQTLTHPNTNTIHVTGRPSAEYVSEETPMMVYANLHLALEQMRVKARRAQRDSSYSAGKDNHPPRVLVVGPENSGKTTACKILTNYTVRAGQGWSPILVNLDPGEVWLPFTLHHHALTSYQKQGGCTIPGTLSASPVDTPIPTSSPENPFGFSATSAPTALSSYALLPLVYWFGHTETRRNPKLMDRLIRNLAKWVNVRLKSDSIGLSIVMNPAASHIHVI